MNITQIQNLSFEEFQRMAPHINITDRLTCADLLEETIRRLCGFDFDHEIDAQVDIRLGERNDDLEFEHETIVEAKDEEISALKEKIEDLEREQIEDLESLPATDGEDTTVLKEKLKKLAKKLKGSQGYSSKMKDELNEVQGTVREQNERIEELQIHVDQAHVLGREYQNDSKLAEERLQEANKACLAIERDRNFHLHKAQEAVARRDAARDEVEPLQKQISKRAAQVSTLMERNTDLDSTLRERTLDLAASERAISDLKEELEAAKLGISSVEVLNARFHAACDQRGQYKERVEQLQKEKDFQIKQLRADHASYKTAIKKENANLFNKLQICQADLQKQKGLVVPTPDATLAERIVNLESRLNNEYDISAGFKNQLRNTFDERNAERERANKVEDELKLHRSVSSAVWKELIATTDVIEERLIK